MSDESTETAVVEQDPAATETEATETEQHDDTGGDDAARARREAKSLRDRLRATEAERDGLTGRLEAMQRAEIGRLAGEKLARGADLLEIGQTPLADLIGEDGTVNADAVTAAATTLTADRGYLRRRRFEGGADGGAGLGTTATDGPSWADVLKR
ncbi:hypothetical protein GCM10009613_11630 [Pseudonocardia kongjuensis]|uniref:Uncharacterized protein n=1 Tax=Pseudonocardia kongjuensis TaxID=102227 RepID=A0ABP4I6M1_9PSEU